MMREEEKPFICYKSKWSMKIVPRNAAGWRYLLYWILPFFAMIAANIWITSALEAKGIDDQKIAIFIVPVFLIFATIWTVALVRWTRSRSEIIDIDELIVLKRDLDRTKKPKRR
jgi:hypothetical protein